MQILTKDMFKQHELNTKINHFTTGIFQFDKCQGIAADDFVVIAGSSGSGKSTLALYMACSAAKSGRRVFYINTENSEKVIVDKIKALGFDFYNDFGDSAMPDNLIILNAKIINYESLEIAVQLHKPELLVIDVFGTLLDKLQKNDIPEKTREYAVEFSFYPEKYGCAVIATEQLVKDNQRIHRPNENDIAGGKSIVTKATKVIIVYRYYKENLDKLMTTSINFGIAKFVAELIVKKDRHDRIPLNIYPVKFVASSGYKELLSAEYQEYQQVLRGKNG